MTDEELAAIHERWNTYAGPLEPAIAQVRALLAEVERLRVERAKLAQVAVEVARLDINGEALCYCWRERIAGHNDDCWVLQAHSIAHTTPSGEMDG